MFGTDNMNIGVNVVLFTIVIAAQYAFTWTPGSPTDWEKHQNKPTSTSTQSGNRRVEGVFKFEIGQVVEHRRFGQRGVIVSRDPVCRADWEWVKRNAFLS